ncbi:MAG: hypothetical protein ACYS8Z_00015 [Planctomycetota bacterium]|jgi:hypothetical protein
MSRLFFVLSAAFVLCIAANALAHNVRPAYLEIAETEPGNLEITWKKPFFQGKPIEIEPVIGKDFVQSSPHTYAKTADAVIDRWTVKSEGGSLAGETISIAGLNATASDVLMRVKLADGSIFRTVLRPNEPSTVIPAAEPESRSFSKAVMLALHGIDSARLYILLIVAAVLRLLPSNRKRGIALCCVAISLGSLCGYGMGRVPFDEYFASNRLPGADESRRTVQGLLLNIYRSFMHEGEEAIYDQLAKSVSGELLADVYLDYCDAMRIDEEDRATTFVDRLDVREIESIERGGAGGVSMTMSWDVYGSVRHWEHTHYRCNSYKAIVTIIPVENFWRISSIEMLDEERVI